MSGIFGGRHATPSSSPVTSLRLQTSTRGRPIPLTYGKPRIAGNLIWYGDLTSTGHQEAQGGKGGSHAATSTTYTYAAAVIMALCEGVVNAIPRVWRQKDLFVDDTDACAQMGLSFARGDFVQVAPGWLQTKHPGEALAYRGLAYVAGSNYALGENADLLNHSFEIETQSGYSADIKDANPADVVSDLLTNPLHGAGFPVAKLGDLAQLSQYCIAHNIFISPAYLDQQAAREIVLSLMKLTNSAAVYSQGKLYFMPYGDLPATANGVTYTPNLTPVYDLTDDDFIGDSGSDPVKVTRKPAADAYNCVRVKFYNRANNYNEEIVEAKDQANIELFGLRAMDVVEFKELCDADVARSVAQLLLQRALYIRNQYEFTLGWNRALLDPMDLVTLTDSAMGMDRVPARVLSIEEDDTGYLAIIAEEFPLNVCNAATYSTQPAVGYSANFNLPPGNALAPVIFEGPVELSVSNDSLDIWIASGGGANYGGCEIWMSVDDATYRQVGQINGTSRIGTLQSTLPAHTDTGFAAGDAVSVQLLAGGQMLSGTLDDVMLLNTLCYAGGEFFAYQGATLTAAGAYTLSQLNRGAYRSKPIAHDAGEPFVRIDDTVAKIALTSDYIGKTVYVKLLAYNKFGGGRQSLSDVAATSYLVTGDLLKLPPPDVEGFSVVVRADGTRVFNWAADLAPRDVTAGGGYRIRYRTFGSTAPWYGMPQLHTGLLKSSPYETHLPKDGIYDFAIEAVDSRGNESANATVELNVIIGDVDFLDARAGTGTAADAMNQTIAALNAKIASKKAGDAQATADQALAEIGVIGDDGWLSKSEKPAIIRDYSEIISEKTGTKGLDAQASTFSVDPSAYDAAVQALTDYLSGLTPPWNDTSQDTELPDPSQLNQKFADVYTSRQLLQNGITAKAATQALWTGVSGTGKPQDNATYGATSDQVSAINNAQLAANNAAVDAAAAKADLAKFSNDFILSKGEKPTAISDYNKLINEQSGIDSTASSLGVSRTAYDNAISALTSYLNGLAPSWTNLSLDTPIDGNFQSKFAAVYTERQKVLNAGTNAAALQAYWPSIWGTYQKISTYDMAPGSAAEILYFSYTDQSVSYPSQIGKSIRYDNTAGFNESVIITASGMISNYTYDPGGAEMYFYVTCGERSQSSGALLNSMSARVFSATALNQNWSQLMFIEDMMPCGVGNYLDIAFIFRGGGGGGNLNNWSATLTNFRIKLEVIKR